MKTNFTLCLILFVATAIFSQKKYRYFETVSVIEGKYRMCNAHRFQDVKTMIELNNWSAIKNIYPKIKKKDLRKLQKLSAQVHSIPVENWGDAGANMVENEDTTRNKFTRTYFILRGNKLQLKGAFTIIVEKEKPYFLDTIIFHKNFPFDKKVEHDLEISNWQPYPPFPFYGCKTIGDPDYFGIHYDENQRPILKVNFSFDHPTYYDFKFPDYLIAEQLDLPIHLSNALIINPTDSLVSFKRFQGFEKLLLFLANSSFLMGDLVENTSIEQLIITLQPTVTRFLVPSDLLKMKNLKKIKIRGKAIVEIPSAYFEANCPVQVETSPVITRSVKY